MTPSPLTPLQQDAVATLVARARLTTSPVDVAKAERFIAMTEAGLDELAHIRAESCDTTSPTTQRTTSVRVCWRPTASVRRPVLASMPP